jgi:septal ring factor EnvC (AmiA/AmiB activator)
MGRPPIGKVAMTGAERVRRYREKHGIDKRQHSDKVSLQTFVTKRLQREVDALRAQLAERDQTIAQLQKGKAADGGGGTHELRIAKAQIKMLQQALRNAMAEVRATKERAREQADAALRKENESLKKQIAAMPHKPGRVVMANDLYKVIVKALHPDTTTPELRQEAAALFNAWADRRVRGKIKKSSRW